MTKKVNEEMKREVSKTKSSTELIEKENNVLVTGIELDTNNSNAMREAIRDKIFMNDDLTRTEREIRKAISSRAQEKKAIGKEVKIGIRKITIDGQKWRWHKDKSRLEKKRTRKAEGHNDKAMNGGAKCTIKNGQTKMAKDNKMLFKNSFVEHKRIV
nr:unnamed protein product [Callosobruchus chinensis]